MKLATVNPQTIIILFTRYPVAGQVKTRLIPALGEQEAARLQQSMTEFAVKQIQQTGSPFQIWHAGGTKAQMMEWLGAEHSYFLQSNHNDLGIIMHEAFTKAFANGAKKVLLMGADCPDNRSANLVAALNALDSYPCVLGPATDGGYYLIGLTAPCPELFTDIAWGTNSVFADTLARMKACKILPTYSDVDEPNNIPQKISVIIPARNEEDRIATTVQDVLQGFSTEAILVDGNSTDATASMAKNAGAMVFFSSPGRALQMNLGAEKATGDIVLFLHADSVLPKGWDVHVRTLLRCPKVYMGYFPFAVTGTFRGKALLEWGTNMRSKLCKLPYGDQGFFLRRSDFFALGGFAPVPILEDVYLVQAARKKGKLACAPCALVTSGRRWKQHGPIKTTMLNQAVLLAAWLGVDLTFIQQAYANGTNPLKALCMKTFFSFNKNKKRSSTWNNRS